MDFIDQLRALSVRVASNKNLIQTEEATKNAMIMPFIQILGYNVFDPQEVTPELIADIGTKKGEKVDYAILQDGKPIIIFECKKSGAELNLNNASQLFRYFHVTEARFAVLTNGITYRFFTDLEQPNKMDTNAFLEFNILDFKDRDVDELKKFAKSAFDVDTILTTANDLKYTRAIQNRLAEWIHTPSEEFVRLVSAGLLGNKKFTGAVIEQFTTITKRAFEQLLGERINDRLKGAMTPEASIISEPVIPIVAMDSVTEALVTSPQEIEAFHIVRALLRNTVNPNRIFLRDSQTYCAIILDDNNRKPICRLRFNNLEKLSLGLFNANKEEERFPLGVVDEIYNYADKIRASVVTYTGLELNDKQ
jgi:predicted type IV restriction endonuclease